MSERTIALRKQREKERRKRAVIEAIAALSSWNVDAYDYGPCAGSVEAKVESIRQDVLAALEKLL